MDQQNQFDTYIQQKVNECLNTPSFASLPQDQKSQMADKISEHFYNVILTTTFDNLTDEQFVAVKDLQPQDPVLAQKLEEYSAQMPFLAQAIQEKLDQDSEYIKQNGQLPPQQ